MTQLHVKEYVKMVVVKLNSFLLDYYLVTNFGVTQFVFRFAAKSQFFLQVYNGVFPYLQVYLINQTKRHENRGEINIYEVVMK
jgi:hypothetical protein